MLGLILDSLGSTEVLFILIVALMFFGPRRLPQLSRTIGKSLAEFRKASEDFKRTWEREVALESARTPTSDNGSASDDASQGDHEARLIQEPAVAPIPAEHVMARQPEANTVRDRSDDHINSPHAPSEPTQSTTAPKSEWL